MRNLKDIKDELFKKYNKKDINHWGILLAVICVFLAIIIPITITNNEVKAAQEAAAEAARIAFEEARQAAIEAEKKAEEERIAALNAALRQEQAEYEAQKAAAAEEEKAAKEREALVSAISGSVVSGVGELIDSQTTEDFNTQYSIQDNLIQTQSKAVTGYEVYVSELLNLYDQKWTDDVKKISNSLENKVDTAKSVITDMQKKQEEEKLVALESEKKAQQEKYESHYNRFNRVDFTITPNSYSLQYLIKTNKLLSFGLNCGYVNDEDRDLLVMGTFGLTFVDHYKLNVGFETSTGIAYRTTDKSFMPSFLCSGILRYTIEDGYEFAFRPAILIETDFSKKCDIKLTPLSFGVSFVF